ncbi:MAG: molybdopterin-synthase adenylyltransferase MoeB [Cytophagaceae bacterium]
MLTPEEHKRYNRHIILKELGMEGQEKLKNAKVLVVGAGGLGCPVLQYISAAGVGTIGIIDGDNVDESNLHRQVLYAVEDIGKAKASVAATKLKQQNPYTNFITYKESLTTDNALDVVGKYDIVVDGTDNFSTRYLCNDACVILNKPLVSGAIFKFEGQISVFNLTDKEGNKGPTYRCLFPEPPLPGEVPTCSEAGVIGVLPGLIGTMQANEVIKIITGIGQPLSGRLLLFDALTMNQSIVTFAANPENFNLNCLGTYNFSCDTEDLSEKNEISVEELKQWMDSGKNFSLLDVREEYEREICNLGGILIPMNYIRDHIEKIPTEKPVVVYCHHGMRSAMIVKFLKQEFQYKNLINLEGGIHAWAKKIDSKMPVY